MTTPVQSYGLGRSGVCLRGGQLTVIPIFFIRKQAFMFWATPSRKR